VKTYLEFNKAAGKQVYKDQAQYEASSAKYRRLVDAWNKEYPDEAFAPPHSTHLLEPPVKHP